MSKTSCSISIIHLRYMKFLLTKGKWSKMTCDTKFVYFAVMIFENQGIKVDRAELLSLGICLHTKFIR